VAETHPEGAISRHFRYRWSEGLLLLLGLSCLLLLQPESEGLIEGIFADGLLPRRGRDWDVIITVILRLVISGSSHCLVGNNNIFLFDLILEHLDVPVLSISKVAFFVTEHNHYWVDLDIGTLNSRSVNVENNLIILEAPVLDEGGT